MLIGRYGSTRLLCDSEEQRGGLRLNLGRKLGEPSCSDSAGLALRSSLRRREYSQGSYTPGELGADRLRSLKYAGAASGL